MNDENIREQRVRIIREVEQHALGDPKGRLLWRENWAAYFGDRTGLLEALAVRRRCLSLIDVEALPGPRDAHDAWRLRKLDAALERVLRRYGAAESSDADLVETA